jgi:hypothetical protein
MRKSCADCARGHDDPPAGICTICFYDADRPHWRASVPEPQQTDPVHKPKHYQLLPGVEVIDVRRALLAKMHDAGWSHYQSDCWSRSWEYLTRAMAKNGLEDLRKCRTYLDRLIKDMEA